MSVCSTQVHSTTECHRVATELIHASQWFSVLPLPDDHFQITVKVENRQMLTKIKERVRDA
jgi:hypothetical protein